MLNQDTNNYFASLKEANAFGTSDVDRTTMTTALDFAQQKANDYIQRFQVQDLSLEEIISTLSQESSEFGKNYQAQLNQPLTIDDNVDATSMMSAFSSSDVSFEHMKKKSTDLKIARTVLITVSATSAVLAAGFWAAAWFFGISIPWAISATLVSGITGSAAAGLGIAIIKYDQELNKWDKAIRAGTSTVSLGFTFLKILSPLYSLFHTADIVLAANSWKNPAALAAIPVISSVLAFIDLFK